MEHRRWTTKPTKTHLDSLKEEYLRIKGTPALVTEFLRRVRNWYFARYSCQDDEIKERDPLKPGEKAKYRVFENDAAWRSAREESLKFWFLNNTKKERKQREGADIKITLGADAGGSNSRKLTNEQVYSKLYYPERVKEYAEAEIERVGATKDQRLAVRNRVIRERLEAETEEVKREVEKKREEIEREKMELAEAVKVLQDSDRGRLNFEELARVQKYIPRILELFFDDLYAKTGWCFHVQGGGPQVEIVNAPIKYTSYSVGLLEGDATFEVWARKEGLWKDHWKPFSTFTHHVFPEDERLRVAIHIDEACVDSKDALAASGRRPGKLRFAEGTCPDAGKAPPQTADQCSNGDSGKGQRIEGAEGGKASSKGGNGGGEGSSMDTSKKGVNASRTAGKPNENKRAAEANDASTTAESQKSKKKKPQGKKTRKGKGVEKIAEVQDTGGVDPPAKMPNTEPLQASDAQVPDVGPFQALNPFDAPPILHQWTQIGQPFGSQSWNSIAPPSGSLSGSLQELINGASGPDTGVNGGSGSVGANDRGSSGCFGVDMSMANLEERLGMSEAMFALAGENVPLGCMPTGVPALPPFPPPTAPSTGGLTLPPSTAGLINPEFQIRRPVGEVYLGLGTAFSEIQGQPRFFGPAVGGYDGGVTEVTEGGGGDVGSAYGGGDVGSAFNGGGELMIGADASDVGAGGVRDVGCDERVGDEIVVGGAVRVGVVDDPSSQKSTAERENCRKRSLMSNEPTEERNKRARTAKKHPEWVDQAREYLLKDLDAPQWIELVAKWHEWEVQCSGLGGVINGTLPGAAARPAIVKKWLAGGCRWDIEDMLEVADAPVFGEKWVKWWNAMQPKARRSLDHTMPRKLGNDMMRAMGALRKAGENGFVLLLRALRMWAPREGSDEGWDLAVHDVLDAIQAVDLRV